MLNYALYNQQAQYGQGQVNPASMTNGITQQSQLSQLSPSTLGVNAVNFAQLQNQSSQIYGVNVNAQDPRVRMMVNQQVNEKKNTKFQKKIFFF